MTERTTRYRLPTRRPKYNNRQTTVDGIPFDSRHEATQYLALKAREQMGEITDLELQVKFPIVVNGQKVCAYIADFVYRERGQKVIADAKGVKTAVYRLKKKLVKAVYGLDIVEL